MSPSATPRASRPPILLQLDGAGHHVIEASAGTGKTFTIEHLVVDRVLAGTPLKRILVVTFSDRAAAELRTRIRALLWKLLGIADGAASGPVVAPEWLLDQAARERLAAAVATLDAASISTIHSFCQRLLTENAFAHKRLFSQRLADGREVFSGVFRDYVRTELVSDPDFSLLLRPHLGGSGFEENDTFESIEKTAYDVVRFHGGLEPRLDPAGLEAELGKLPSPLPSAEAVLQGLGGQESRKKKRREQLQTVLDALQASRSATGYVRCLALGPLFEKADPKQTRLEYVLHNLKDVKTDPAIRDCLQSMLLYAAAHVPGADVLLFLHSQAELQARLRRFKKEQGLFDFEDMLQVVGESLRSDSAEAIQSTLRERYDVALIDEFQDTDPTQWEIFRTLFVGPGSPTSLSVIGDPKQAIYGFRAADVHTYLGARQQLAGGGGSGQPSNPIVRLTANFRSSERMIRAYNLILRQETAAEATIFQANEGITYGRDAEVTCGDPVVRLIDRAGRELSPVQLLKPGDEAKSLGDNWPVKLFARTVAREAERLLGPEGPLLFDKSSPQGRPLRPNDLYVLSRKRRESLVVAEELGKRSIPFSFYKQEGLFQTEEAADLLDLVAAVSDPFDRPRRARAWLTMFFGLRPIEVERSLDAPDDHPLVARLRAWHELGQRREFARLFSAITEESGLAARAALLPAGERALANVRRILELLAAEARTRHASLGELVSLLRSWIEERSTPPEQDGDTQPLETDRSTVQLMTMHKAKGLEAAVVFVVGGFGKLLEDDLHVYHREGARQGWLGRPPEEIRELVTREARGDEERLLYVALTRARVRLYLPVTEPKKKSKEGEDPVWTKGAGSYEILNLRLNHLGQAPLDGELFETQVVQPGQAAAPASEPPAEALSGWAPPQPLSAGDDQTAARRALARNRRGPLVTSYSQLAQSERATPLEVDRREATGETNLAETPIGELVTSNVVGNFLHEALEGLRLPLVASLGSLAAFSADPEIQLVVEPLADAAGIATAQRPHAYRLLWAALRLPLALDGAGELPGIATLPRVRRELEFLFPIPEATHALLGQPALAGEAPFQIGRGLIKGFIDLVFEHGGRTYVADWKSSVLRATSKAALDDYVEQHFRWQVMVYGIASLRLLGIADAASYEKRFGGFLYLFLREMEKGPDGQPARGVWFSRPPWEVVRTWEQTLLGHGYGLDGGTP